MTFAFCIVVCCFTFLGEAQVIRRAMTSSSSASQHRRRAPTMTNIFTFDSSLSLSLSLNSIHKHSCHSSGDPSTVPGSIPEAQNLRFFQFKFELRWEKDGNNQKEAGTSQFFKKNKYCCKIKELMLFSQYPTVMLICNISLLLTFGKTTIYKAITLFTSEAKYAKSNKKHKVQTFFIRPRPKVFNTNMRFCTTINLILLARITINVCEP